MELQRRQEVPGHVGWGGKSMETWFGRQRELGKQKPCFRRGVLVPGISEGMSDLSGS